jgi:hypothetical protein
MDQLIPIQLEVVNLQAFACCFSSFMFVMTINMCDIIAFEKQALLNLQVYR